MSDTERPLTPESRARKRISGTPVVMSDRKAWILANTVPAWGPLWDRLHDQNVTRGRYEQESLMVGAVALLLWNYDITGDEAGALVLGGDIGGMRDAIERAMFLPSRPQWTYSDWVMSSLAANGLELADIPDGVLPAVLDQLVRMGRAVPEHLFVSTTARASRRGAFHAVARQQAAQRAAKSAESPDA